MRRRDRTSETVGKLRTGLGRFVRVKAATITYGTPTVTLSGETADLEFLKPEAAEALGRMLVDAAERAREQAAYLARPA